PNIERRANGGSHALPRRPCESPYYGASSKNPCAEPGSSRNLAARTSGGTDDHTSPLRPAKPTPGPTSSILALARCGGALTGDHGSGRTLRDQGDDEHLRARAACASPGGGRRHR